jgi:hypothetical protein
VEGRYDLRYCSSKETGRGFGVRYSLVGFSVERLLEGVIKGRGRREYMHRKLVKVQELLLWVAVFYVVVRRVSRRGRRKGRRSGKRRAIR